MFIVMLSNVLIVDTNYFSPLFLSLGGSVFK